MASNVQFTSELFLCGYSTMILYKLNIDCVKNIRWISSDYVSKKGIGKSDDKQTVYQKVKEKYGKGKLLEGQ